jgi:hypothetical protein
MQEKILKTCHPDMGKFWHDTSLTLFFVNHNTVNHYRYILCHGSIGIIIIPDTGNVPLIIFFNMQTSHPILRRFLPDTG